ncbi:WW domain-binding protein 4-like [Pollicipes pollicipes]|uniref:WW domain-binding protein 4-like n=1 Tax=Pollicipes pollicipes TaxID=41117 RepID=UPI0018850B67|nr:WW domain-binding protein 4-like [Pollicipes pollicipes]XP_037070622.1 WW domain-binding protein 4-like [Pollicipes pollicipes]XP_037070623.1 WW domain-binding protein 4-like [Pollicipes pollicipes]XP_037070624.1 WW domain-binding protein 4-like [Pollicipes pollicipes]
MADYWKSNPRKFCDFCKCWFADNRSSIEFHERGKRHQEAVKERLAELAKRGRRDHIEQQQLEADMQQMEKAAMAAFKKDLMASPDLAKQYGVTLGRKATGDAAAPMDGVPLPEQGPTLDGAPLPRETTPPAADGAPPPAEDAEPVKKWLEAKSEQGYSYYWHVDTGEAVWEPPEEGYVALPDCAPPEPSQEPANPEPEKEKEESEPAAEKDEEPPPPSEDVMGPANRPDPYGSKWEEVHREPAAPVDLQLPEQRRPAVQPAVRRDKARIVFRQRTVGSLGAGADETFKRRRTDGEKKRNIRQRTDD